MIHASPVANSRGEPALSAQRASIRRLWRLATLGVALAMAGCGFHLEGSGSLPAAMAKTFVDSRSPHSVFLQELVGALRLHGTNVVDVADQAQAVLDITSDDTGQRVLSVSARNIPREYEIFYSVTFSLRLGGQRFIDRESLFVTRSYTYDETQVLAKAAEEDVLRRSLAEDLARRVVRRIEALGANPQPLPTTAPKS